MVDLPKYTNQEWLEYQYVNLNKTIQQISNEQKIPYHKIRLALIEFKIPIRNNNKGKNHPNWKGGRSLNKTYKTQNTSRGFIPIYIIKTEKKLGRNLNSNEVVHHIDNNKRNDNLHNLYLCKNRSQHAKIHSQFNAIAQSIAMNLYDLHLIKFNRILGKYYIDQDEFKEEFSKYFKEKNYDEIRKMDLMRL